METINLGSRSQVRPESIKLLKADINYTTIFFLDGTKVLVSTTMGIIESRLPREKFLRINRGTVINREMVSHYFIRPDYDEVKLQDASFVKVSRRRRMEMRQILISQ
ncbi:MAG: LytTR family transcriptional regulator [Cytophagaceae bacterium]|nr:LytTR family transcriptional regulator [Cytophagaceae bacterium]MBK9934843.1 LytTR family transcriptional regulator [Cytophagaceae bacterium]MBL0301281.1 LytTR family transcriptional regulator [Cytophagaceae bacterium]MBL0324098.1 LytTR family transcriptional regulator [Cytophagaceae bacterium]